MSLTCKECHWWIGSQHECCRNGKVLVRETNGINPSYAVSLYPEAKPDDPACSHFQSIKESPGTLNFTRQYGPDGCEHVFIYHDQYQRATLKKLEDIITRTGQIKTFRLELVEEKS